MDMYSNLNQNRKWTNQPQDHQWTQNLGRQGNYKVKVLGTIKAIGIGH